MIPPGSFEFSGDPAATTGTGHLHKSAGFHHAQHQLRLEHQTHAHTVTITERRAPWNPDDGSEWTSRPLAQRRHNLHGWRLHWANSNSRWQVIHDVPTATDLTPPLKIIDDPDQQPSLG